VALSKLTRSSRWPHKAQSFASSKEAVASNSRHLGALETSDSAGKLEPFDLFRHFAGCFSQVCQNCFWFAASTTSPEAAKQVSLLCKGPFRRKILPTVPNLLRFLPQLSELASQSKN